MLEYEMKWYVRSASWITEDRKIKVCHPPIHNHYVVPDVAAMMNDRIGAFLCIDLGYNCPAEAIQRVAGLSFTIYAGLAKELVELEWISTDQRLKMYAHHEPITVRLERQLGWWMEMRCR